MNPELRKRLVDSIEYLRRLGFFQDYSDLTSEEILERIFSGEINYETQWFVEEMKERNEDEYWESRRILKIKPHRVHLRKYVVEHEEERCGDRL